MLAGGLSKIIFLISFLCVAALPSFGAEREGKSELKPGGAMAAVALTSKAFQNNHPLPTEFSRDGGDLSPPLSWSGLPQNIQELALIMDDPDAPAAEPWVHWVVYAIPAGLK